MAIQRHLSKKARRDPTGSIQWERKYQNGITPLINNFKGKLIKEFTRAWEGRELEVGKLDPSKFYPRVDELAEDEIRIPAGKVIQKVIPRAFDQGQLFAGIVLGAPLEERQRAWSLIKILIETNESEFKGFSDDSARRVKRIIGDGVLNERTQGQIIKDIQKEVEMSQARAKTIVRTEVQKAVNTGVTDRYRRAGVEVVEWLAAFDRRTCDECGDLDGRKFEIDAAPPCPKHPNCRCTLIAVVRVKPGDEVEKWTPGDEKPKPPIEAVSINDRLNNFISENKGSKVETFEAYDANGNLIGRSVGDAGSARVPTVDLSNTHMIHNHPGGGGTAALSPEDVAVAIERNAASMRCVDDRGVSMIITRPDGGWPPLSADKIKTAYDETWKSPEIRSYVSDLQAKVTSGKRTIDAANKAATRVWTSTTLDKLGLNPVIKKGV